jgi:hypothetical protein
MDSGMEYDVVGPDGQLYDVLYPADSPLEELSPRSYDDSSESTSSRSGVIAYPLRELDQAASASNAQLSSVGAVHSQTSAEVGILSILTYMRSVAAERYPARVHLFETVHAAAARALGEHFERFALVGSTALRIDTPDSDLDAVVFTQSSWSPSGEQQRPPLATETLRRISKMLQTSDPSLRLQLVDCTRVPVLTVFSADEQQSLDLTVDQPLSEWHVLWIQSQRKEPVFDPPFMHGVPVPTLDGWEQGLEAAALRCIKWWLRRRHIPVTKEGGYPTVVWTLMVIHALRCSVFYNEAVSMNASAVVNERTLLGAIAAFFDRFSEGGLSGTLFFAEGKRAEFWPQALPDNTAGETAASGALSVLDPTTTSEDCAAFGIEPVELAPQLSQATQLLHTYELRRAQVFSSLALEEEAPNSEESGAALSALFAEADESLYILPAVVPKKPVGVIFLCDGALGFGILDRIHLKPGWGAAFLHRHDAHSRLAVKLCNIDTENQTAVLQDQRPNLHWIVAADVVCMASISKRSPAYSWGYQAPTVFDLDAESFHKWCMMHTLLGHDVFEGHTSQHSKALPKGRSARNKRHGKVVRI